MTRNATARNIGKTDKSAILDEVERLADILLTSSDGPDLDVTTKLEVFDLVEELTRTSPEEPSPIVRWYNDEARRDDSDNGNDGPVQSKPATVLGRIIAELSRIRFTTDERRHNATGDRKTSEVVSWRAKGHSLKRQVENARQVYGIKCDSAKPSNSKKHEKKRRGRPPADEETIRREAEIADAWKRARESRVYKPDWAKENGFESVKEFDNLLGNVRKRRKRAAEKQNQSRTNSD